MDGRIILDIIMGIYSKIDSDRFGLKVGRVGGELLNFMPVQTAIRCFADEQYDLIIARVNGKNIRLINQLEENGFRFKDAQNTFRYRYKGTVGPAQTGYTQIRDFVPSDLDELLAITKSAFQGYGHYHANDRLSKDDALAVYVDWCYNSCTKPGVADKILVKDSGDGISGYLTFQVKEKGSFRYAVGGIGAVSPEYQGMGVFSDIVMAGLDWGRRIGLTWQEHNVLSNNFAVNKVFIRAGFMPEEFVVTMHGWINKDNEI